jgi:hypothetical protein
MIFQAAVSTSQRYSVRQYYYAQALSTVCRKKTSFGHILLLNPLTLSRAGSTLGAPQGITALIDNPLLLTLSSQRISMGHCASPSPCTGKAVYVFAVEGHKRSGCL